jgi:hypothetical protein
VKNALTITKLEREHTLGKLRCLANNNNITRPVESAVVLKMLCKLLNRTPGVDFMVRTIARALYKRKIRVIGLNVVYLLMFNNDSTKHMSE